MKGLITCWSPVAGLVFVGRPLFWNVSLISFTELCVMEMQYIVGRWNRIHHYCSHGGSSFGKMGNCSRNKHGENNENPGRIAQSVQWLGYGVEVPGFGPRQRHETSSLCLFQNFQTSSVVHQPPLQRKPAAFSPGVNRPEREADLLSPYAEVKNDCSYTAVPLTCLHEVCKEIFTFLFWK